MVSYDFTGQTAVVTGGTRGIGKAITLKLASEGADWKAAIRRSAISAHEVLERHPWACGLMMSPARVRPGRMRYIDSMLGR